MKHISILAAAVALALGVGTVHAEEGGVPSSFCDSESGCEVGTPSPPPPPEMPQGVSYNGTFFTYPYGNVVQGGIANGQVYTFGGGAGSPYTGQLYTAGSVGSSAVTMQASLQPIASVTVTGAQVTYGRADASLGLGYRIILRADDAASANQISQLLNTSGAIAHVSGSFNLAADGYGYSSVNVVTGSNLASLDPSLASSFYRSCGQYGVVSSASTAGCGAGSFNLAVNFVSGSQFSDGNPQDFIGVIQLGGTVNVGTAAASITPYPGTATAFIDPMITLAPGIRAKLILGDGGNVSNVAAVPEPESWALLMAGLGVVAVALRRRT